MPQNQSKSKKYVRYEDLSKDELIKMLMRLNKRLTRIQSELRAVINILYYGTPESDANTSGASGGYKGRTGGYTRGKGYSGYKYGGKYRRKAPQPEEGGEAGEEEEVVEEEAKPAEKKSGEAKAETKPEKGGS
ncbi:MAG: hypothetical protein RQ842_05735 [Vulcanisaeta sp.]|jgi:hypothetical protein|nr:hypothetical protein [Vulcanisaeta sp.]